MVGLLTTDQRLLQLVAGCSPERFFHAPLPSCMSDSDVVAKVLVLTSP